MSKKINIKNSEKRYYNLDLYELSCRLYTDDKGKRHIKGYGSVFNQKSRVISEWVDNVTGYRTFTEIIEFGAFDNVLRSNPYVVISVDHDFTRVLGKTSSRTATIGTDEKGLWFDVILPNTTLGNDTAEMVERGDFNECSFIFTVDSDGQRWEKDENGDWVRRITNVLGLYDCTICSYKGAYENTDVAVASRMLGELIEAEQRTEQTEQTEQTEETKVEETNEETKTETVEETNVDVLTDEEKQRYNDELFLLENEIN